METVKLNDGTEIPAVGFVKIGGFRHGYTVRRRI